MLTKFDQVFSSIPVDYKFILSNNWLLTSYHLIIIYNSLNITKASYQLCF